MMNRKANATSGLKAIAAIALVLCAGLGLAFTSVGSHHDGKVYEKVDQMPVFNGCDRNGVSEKEVQKCSMTHLIEHLVTEIKYPEKQKKEGIGGTVHVEFVVTENGEVSKVRVLKPIQQQLDVEAVRVVKGMPNWTPGQHEGSKVSVKMVLPIKFSIEE